MVNKKSDFWGRIKLEILTKIFNPYYKFLFWFLTILYYFYFIILLNPDNILGNLITITFYVVLVIVLFDSIGEIFIDTNLNKKQLSFLQKYYLIITLPISIPIIYNFSTGYSVSLSYAIFSSFIVFFIFNKITKSIRYSFLITYVFLIIINFIFHKGTYFLFNSLLISNFFLAFGLRFSQLNPRLKFENEEVEKFIEYKNRFKNKLKEIKNHIVFKYEEIVLIRDDFYFITKKGVKNKSEGDVLKEDIPRIDRLLEIKNKLQEIYTERLNLLKRIKFYNKIRNELVKDKFGKERIEKMESWLINLIQKKTGKKSYNFISISIISLISLLIFNPKIMRRVSKITYENYHLFPTEFKKMDNRAMWKSDLELDYYREQSEEDEWYINILLNNFIGIPDDKGIDIIKERVKIALDNAKKYNYKKIVDKRYKNARSLYKTKLYLISSYKSVKDSAHNTIKYFEDLKNILGE